MNLAENLKLKWDLSLISLIVTNIIVIVLAIIQKWDFPTVISIYIAQTQIIGFFYFLRIILKQKYHFEGIKINNQPIFPSSANKFILAIIFGGIFFTTLRFYSNLLGNRPITNIFVYFSVLLFFVNHLISFITNLKSDQEKEESIRHMLISPFFRIIPMHLILFIGNILNIQVVIFIILKTIADIYMHNYMHNYESKSQPIASPIIKSNNIDLPIMVKNNLTNTTTFTNISVDKNLFYVIGKWIIIITMAIVGILLLGSLLIGVIAWQFSRNTPFIGFSISWFLTPIIIIGAFVYMWFKYKNDPTNPYRNNKGIAIVIPQESKKIETTLVDIKNAKGIDIGIKGIGFSLLLLIISTVVFCVSWFISLLIIMLITFLAYSRTGGTISFSLNSFSNSVWFYSIVLIIPIITTMLLNFFIIRNKLKQDKLSKIVFLVYFATIMIILLKIILSIFN